MKDLNANSDPIGPLGQKITQPPIQPPSPQPRVIRPGIVEVNGKLETSIPGNERAKYSFGRQDFGGKP